MKRGYRSVFWRFSWEKYIKRVQNRLPFCALFDFWKSGKMTTYRLISEEKGHFRKSEKTLIPGSAWKAFQESPGNKVFSGSQNHQFLRDLNRMILFWKFKARFERNFKSYVYFLIKLDLEGPKSKNHKNDEKWKKGFFRRKI